MAASSSSSSPKAPAPARNLHVRPSPSDTRSSPPCTDLPDRRTPTPINPRIHVPIPSLPLTSPPAPPRRTVILNHLDNIIFPLPLRWRPPRLLNNNGLVPRLPPRWFPLHAPGSAYLADFCAAGAGARAPSAWGAGPSSHDFFFGDHGAAASPVHVETGVD